MQGGYKMRKTKTSTRKATRKKSYNYVSPEKKAAVIAIYAAVGNKIKDKKTRTNFKRQIRRFSRRHKTEDIMSLAKSV